MRWERLVALVQESLRADQVQALSWLWDVSQDFDAHFKSHVGAFLLAAAQAGPGQRLLAYRAFQPDAAGNSPYHTVRARELSLKKRKLFEEHGRKLSGAKPDYDDAGIASKRHRRGSRGSGRGIGAAGGGAQQQTQRQASQQRQQQQQPPQQQQRSSSGDSRGRQGPGRGGSAAGGGAARGGRGGGPQGGAGGGGAPALPP